nr:UDP-N-acetylmuramoyl-tripeptide--D-alanyl-D-alanine ligase [uncultured Porphyromonas sp.]
MLLDDLYQLYLEHPTVSTDTRRLSPGCIFFALKGANFDGNRYARQALEAGAAYAVLDDPEQLIDERTLLVEDVLTSLQQLAAHHRRQLGTPILAITGTNGKTTTKELTAAVLSARYPILYTEGNLNNHIGVPLTLLRLGPEHQWAIIEMGASHPGDIAELCAIADPDYGLITNIGAAHLEGFGSLEGVRATKGELYDHIRAKGAQLFVHADDPMLLEMSVGVERHTYGTSPEAELRGEALHEDGSLQLALRYRVGDYEGRLATQLVGDYNLPNVLAALAVGSYLGVPYAAMEEALAHYAPSNSRSQLIETERGNRLIADAYNANPSSMHTALQNFLAIPQTPGQGRVLILGDMNELGAASESAHHELLEEIRRAGQPLRLYLCGPCWMRELAAHPDPEVAAFAEVGELIQSLQAAPISDSLILIKGSNGIKLGSVLEYL